MSEGFKVYFFFATYAFHIYLFYLPMNLIEYVIDNHLQALLTAVILLTFAVIRILLMSLVKRHAKNLNVVLSREIYIKKLVSWSLLLVFLSVIGMVWEISLQGLSLYFASIFTVVGVGLFANWSILSNMTASVILFFFFPYRIGQQIKIVDGDNSIEGEIIDITLFYIKIMVDKKVCSYPNNLAISKPIFML